MGEGCDRDKRSGDGSMMCTRSRARLHLRTCRGQVQVQSMRLVPQAVAVLDAHSGNLEAALEVMCFLRNLAWDSENNGPLRAYMGKALALMQEVRSC